MRRSRSLRCLRSLTLLTLAACSSSDPGPPPEGQSGAQLFESQGCAVCHGADGTSAFWRPGPNLLPNLDTWAVPELAQYLADPDSVAERVERLTPGSMAGFPHLDEATRLRLADYVLTLDDAVED
jgi:mono/diheme cytochrome c family protein